MFDKDKVKLGIAPIAWTNDDLPDLGAENTFEQCISEMALAGFTGSEVGNKYPKDRETLKKALGLRGIEICNQWFSCFLLTKPFEEVEHEFRQQLAFLRDMGAKIIGASEQSYSVQGQQDTPVFGQKYSMDDTEWRVLCTGLNRLGRIAKEEYGISLTFHHHMGTVVQNPDEVKRLMENTEPEYVSLLFDTRTFCLLWSRSSGNGKNIHAQNTPCSFKRYSPGNCTGGSEKETEFSGRCTDGGIYHTGRRSC